MQDISEYFENLLNFNVDSLDVTGLIKQSYSVSVYGTCSCPPECSL
jgi:hypothetical protein